MALFLVAMAPATFADPVIQNGGFEAGLDGWETDFQGRVGIDIALEIVDVTERWGMTRPAGPNCAYLQRFEWDSTQYPTKVEMSQTIDLPQLADCLKFDVAAMVSAVPLTQSTSFEVIFEDSGGTSHQLYYIDWKLLDWIPLGPFPFNYYTEFMSQEINISMYAGQSGHLIFRMRDMGPEFIQFIGVLVDDVQAELVPEPVIYVDADANGANDGSSWADAYNYLQDALADANSNGDVNEIWVAEGIYTPDSNSADPNGSGDREATFQLINGVAIYGGFVSSETSLDQRDWKTNETILSGDLNGDDGPNFANNSENSYHIVTGSGIDRTAVIDGFTITAGNADGPWQTYQNRGGGMHNSMGSPTVTNCTFSGNSAGLGGGMHNWDNSSPTLTNCAFNANSAYIGGGMYNYESSPTVTNCTFSGNSATSYGPGGGGGMCNERSSPTVTDCTFSGNSAAQGGGMYNEDSNAVVIGCTFTGNSASEGGVIYNGNSSPTITNCMFSGNSAGNGGGIYNASGSSPILTNCTFNGNSADNYGGGMVNIWYCSPTITNCTFSGNSAGSYGGGMYNWSSSPTMTNCILWGNTAASDGNEIAVANSSTIDVNHCDIKDGNDGIYNSGSTINWGSGNIDADPMFVDGSNPDPNLRDYHLRPGSPCIDAGDNNSVPTDNADLDGDGDTTEPIPFDLDGGPRFVDGDCNATDIVDMGAYEFSYAYMGDFDYNCEVDFGDFAILALTWLSEDGEAQYNPVCDISEPNDNFIDERDLGVFCDNWLLGM